MGQPWSTLEGQLVTLSNAGATNWITSKKKCCRKHHFSSPTRPKITHTQNRKILHFALWSHVLCRTYYVRRPRFHFKLHFMHSVVTLLFWLLKKASQSAKTWIREDLNFFIFFHKLDVITLPAFMEDKYFSSYLRSR